MARDNGIETFEGGLGGVGVDRLHLEPGIVRLGLQPPQHALGEVESAYQVAIPGQQDGQEPRPGAHVEHSRGRRRQEPAQRGGPRGQFQRGARVVPRRSVVCRRIDVPIRTDLLLHCPQT